MLHSHEHAHAHNHDHDRISDAPLRALLIALGVTSVVFFAELIGGWITGSMALMADAMHMLSDAAGLIIAVIAVVIGKRAASMNATYGYRRVEVLAAAVNALTVLLISIWIVVQAIRRISAPTEIDTGPMMVIAVIGLVANVISAWVLHSQRENSVNVEGAFLHVLVDMLGSVAVLVAGAVIAFTGSQLPDVIASFLIAALVLPRAWSLLRHSLQVLLEQVPPGFDVECVEPALRAIDGVVDIHDLHLWSLDGVSVLATVHMVKRPGEKASRVLDEAQETLRELGIEHSTIQVELPEHRGHENVC